MASFLPLATPKISKVDKLTPPNTLDTVKYRLYLKIVWCLRGLKGMSILTCVHLEVCYNLFKNTRKSFLKSTKVLCFLVDIYQV